MPSSAQGLEHLRRHAGMSAHADADDGDFGDVGIHLDALGVHGRQSASRRSPELSVIGLGHGERQIRGAVFAGVLDDHVDDDVRVRDGTKDSRRQSRLIGHPDQGDFCFVFIARHAGNQHIAHALLLIDQPGTFRSENVDRTCTGTENFLANSTERISKTLAPVLASSIISS